MVPLAGIIRGDVLTERLIVPEMLDHAPPDVTRASLRDLARINRYLGGYYVLGQLFDGVVRRDESFSVLDVGAASGDMGAAIRRRYPHAQVTSLDYKGDHLTQAADPKLVADAFRLPFRSASFDFVFSSLFLHHFSNDQVVELFRSFRCLARRAVLAIDLERGPLAYYFLPNTRWLFGWHDITISDGQISVAAALKKHELRDLAVRAGLDGAQVRVHRPWSRLSLVAPV
ncbi:MAG: methyltransferase domain-containing protein [Bryobacteraceae bacterium]